MKIAVITPTVPERRTALEQCKAAVAAQTVSCTHIVRMAEPSEGCWSVRNKIAAGLPDSYDWLAFVDDDDLLLPDHLETLSNAGEGDIFYSECRTEGWDKTWQERPFDVRALAIKNFIPVTVLMRRSLFDALGGFRATAPGGIWPEDWDLWIRAANCGARFVYVSKVTWIYRRVDDSMLVRGF